MNIQSDDFWSIVYEGLLAIARVEKLIRSRSFKLVIISHSFNFDYGLIGWFALKAGIDVVLPFGLFGVTRMTHMKSPSDLTDFYDRPKLEDINALDPSVASEMRSIGAKYLSARKAGRADDLASIYAYQRTSGRPDRSVVCDRFGWDPEQPIIGFYASNWYDWPHQLGMTQFRDFLDWTKKTFEVATETKGVNWLFKPHPCEDWFGGVSLKDIMESFPKVGNVGIADKSWNNSSVMEAIDALVTYHGTAGIEFASMGKPVLLPDRGKYHDCGFARVAASRQHYIDLLSETWWLDFDAQKSKENAELFAGWWFCAPSWQGEFLIGDDSRQADLYDQIPFLISSNDNAVRKEVEHLREWFLSGHKYSHTYKMMHSKAFQLTNI